MTSADEYIANLEKELAVKTNLLALVLYSIAEPVEIREEYYDDALNGRVIQLDETENGLVIELVKE